MRNGQAATARSPSSTASTSSVASAYTARSDGSPKSGRCDPGKPPTWPLAPTMPTSQSPMRSMVQARSRTLMPASSRIAVSSGTRLTCQSWLPSTAMTGVSIPLTASARSSPCSGWPWVVRSPASRIRSAASSISAKADATAWQLASVMCMSPAAAMRTALPSGLGSGAPGGFSGTTSSLPTSAGVSICDVSAQDQPFSQMEASLKKAAAALREAEIPFLLGGSLASWARGGPETTHDLDFMLKPEDAERALEVLCATGMKAERPPEEWLLKVWDGDVLIDLIYGPSGIEMTDEVIERGETLNVLSMEMKVMSLEDVLTTKLEALTEHSLDYAGALQIARALREQIDWKVVRERTHGSPYAKAFFVLVEELGIAPAAAEAATGGVR